MVIYGEIIYGNNASVRQLVMLNFYLCVWVEIPYTSVIFALISNNEASVLLLGSAKWNENTYI